MSGGKPSPDPYYDKAPPKKKKKQRLDPSELPVKPIGPVKVIPMPKFGKRPMTGTNRTGLNWYTCDQCGNVYLSRNPAGGVQGYCGPDCHGKAISARSKGIPQSDEHKRKRADARRGKKHSEDTKRKLSEGRKKLFEDPKFRERMKRAKNTPEAREKAAAGKRGHLNPNWKGGSQASKRVRTPADEYRDTAEWRRKAEEIRNRDNNTCQSCGKKGQDGENLDVHHTYPLNQWIDDGEDPNDYPDDWLMSLDKSCHSKADAQDEDFKYPPEQE